MTSARTIPVTTVWLLMMVAPLPVAAQDVVASSFDQLHLALRLGDPVAITDTSGRQVKGKFVDLTSSALMLVVDRTRRELAQSDITRIARGHRNPGAGAKWGLLVGAAFGAVAILNTCSGAECYVTDYALAPALFGGIGAGIGAGLGALTTTYDVVYQKSTSSSVRVTMSPLMTPERKGVALSFGF